ncbi:MAG: ABC transporter ATP-binding protein [Acidimicrobiia bacterium]
MTATTLRYWLAPHRGRIGLVVLCQAGAALLAAWALASISPVVGSALISDAAGTDSALVLRARQLANLVPVESPVGAAIVVFLLLTMAAEAATYATGLFAIRVRAAALRDCMVQAYEKVLYADYVFFLEHRHSDLNHLISVAAYNTQTLFLVIDLAGIGLQVLAVLLLLGSIAPTAGAAVALVAVVAYGVVTMLSARRLIDLGEAQRRESARQTRALDEATRGMRFLRVFETGAYWQDGFRRATDAYTRAAVRQELFRLAPGSLTSILFVWSIAVAVWLLWRREGVAFDNYLPIVAVFVLALRQLLTLMASAGDAVMGIVAAVPYADTVRRALEEPNVTIRSGTRPFAGLSKSLELRGVHFTHRGRTRTVSGLSFTVPAGTTTAIVGASGAGKSTVIDLLMRLYDPDEGAIMVDGEDLRTLDLQQWRASIGLMSQEPFLFKGTIRDNIAMGLPTATDEAIQRAAEQADIHAFITQLPGGYDTELADRGMTLSGGQRQRIALARALVRQPRLLLLDEATSSVDNRSESVIRNALNQVKRSCTLIVVAHKLATVRDADQLILVGDGQVLERGTHTDLMNLDGAYARLYRNQTL